MFIILDITSPTSPIVSISTSTALVSTTSVTPPTCGTCQPTSALGISLGFPNCAAACAARTGAPTCVDPPPAVSIGCPLPVNVNIGNCGVSVNAFICCCSF